MEELLPQIASTRENARVRAVFGEPIRQGDRVQGGFGLGFGRGKMFRARPVAVIGISPGGVRIRPIVDLTRLLLASMLLVALVVFWGNVTARALLRRGRSA